MAVEESFSSDEEEQCFETDFEAIEMRTLSKIAKAAFDENRNNRNELITLRKKMMGLQRFLEKKGLSMAQFERKPISKKHCSM